MSIKHGVLRVMRGKETWIANGAGITQQLSDRGMCIEFGVAECVCMPFAHC